MLRLKQIGKKTWPLWVMYTLAATAVSIQKLTQGHREGGYTFYENYRIFKNAFAHLLQGLNPYAAFPAEQWDLYKYSPAFAIFMAPFAAMPDWLGLPAWNLLNALILLYAVLKLPWLDDGQRRFAAWFVLIELITSLQNSQSNGLTAGLMLLAFIALDRKKPAPAAGYIAGAAYIKIFGIFAAVLAPLYPYTYRNGRFSGWLLGWTLLLALLPLAMISAGQLKQVYAWWLELLRDDHEASVGLSVQGWLQSWFGWAPSKTGVTLAGLAMLLVSILPAVKTPTRTGKMLTAASILIWVVIFNHKAESPTFIIAMCGVALWWFASEKKVLDKWLLWTTFALVSLSPTDIFPKTLRQMWVQPYVLKAVPCIAVWTLITWRLLKGNYPHDSNEKD
ncbi:MAG: glycosyltransferase family 87 protein [Saprospiraceae bacterium]